MKEIKRYRIKSVMILSAWICWKRSWKLVFLVFLNFIEVSSFNFLQRQAFLFISYNFLNSHHWVLFIVLNRLWPLYVRIETHYGIGSQLWTVSLLRFFTSVSLLLTLSIHMFLWKKQSICRDFFSKKYFQIKWLVENLL